MCQSFRALRKRSLVIMTHEKRDQPYLCLFSTTIFRRKYKVLQKNRRKRRKKTRFDFSIYSSIIWKWRWFFGWSTYNVFTFQSSEFCLSGHRVALILRPAASAASLPQTCTTMEGVEMLLPSRVTCLAGWSSWFSPENIQKFRENTCYT